MELSPTTSTTSAQPPLEQFVQNVPVANALDNELSMLYKWAGYYGVPVKYLVAIGTDILSSIPALSSLIPPGTNLTNTSVIYLPLTNLVNTLLTAGYIPTQIYDFLVSPNVTLFNSLTTDAPSSILDDLAMVIAGLYLPTVPETTPEVTLLQTINGLYAHTGSKNVIPNIQALRDQYDIWSSQALQLFTNDQKNLNIMQNLQEELAEYPPLLATPIALTSVDIRVRFKTNDNKDVQPADGIEIFNRAQVSPNIPYIQYNEETRLTDAPALPTPATSSTMSTVPRYFKIWSSFPANRVPETVGSRDTDKFFILIRLGNDEYGMARYDLATNSLSLRVPLTSGLTAESVVESISKSLSLTPGPITQTRATGTFEIMNFQIYETILLDLILNHPLMNSYLYIDEQARPFALASRLSIHFKSVVSSTVERSTEGQRDANDQEDESLNPSSVTANLFQNYTDLARRITIYNEENQLVEYEVPAGTPYAVVNITRASSETTIRQFIEIFRRLMAFYSDEDTLTPLVRKYERYFPGIQLQPRAVPTTPKTPSRGRVGTTQQAQVIEATRSVEEILDPGKRQRLSRLKRLAPALIRAQYARTCQPTQRQPDIITPEEAVNWQKSTFNFKGQIRQRQTMPYPPTNPEWIFVCPNPSYPFPGVSQNTRMDNRDKYPYVPCCFMDEDQMKPGTNTLYNLYINNATPAPTRKNTTKGLTSNKLLTFGKIGQPLPLAIDFLSTRIRNPTRVGVVRSPNSLIHCVMLATKFPPYIAATTDEKREETARALRLQFANRYRMELLKQEFYDESLDQIRRQVANVNLFFDTALFYRLLEVAFNINIYTITTITDNRNEPIALEAPRYSQFPVRVPRPNQLTVLIYKSLGSEADNLDYPQCDLIASVNPQNRTSTYIFSTAVTEHMIEAFQTMYQTLTWLPTAEGLSGHLNLYSQIDYQALLGGSSSIRAQILDSVGKKRGYLLNTGVLFTFPPSQPDNLPQANLTNFQAPPLETVRTLFPNNPPTGILRRGPELIGLWYRILDLTFGVFVPVRPQPVPADLENLPNGPATDYLLLTPTGPNKTLQIEELRRTVDRLLQLVLWLFRVSQMNLQNFLATVEVGNDPRYVYNLNSLPRRLPDAQNFEEGLAVLAQIAPTLVPNGRLFISSQKLRESLEYFLSLYINTHPSNQPINNLITGLYTRAQDFIQYPQTRIFVSEKQLRDWQSSLLRNTTNIPVRRTLETVYGLSDEPYLYISPEARVFLIQNVIVDATSRLRAINVAYYWESRKVNPGRSTPAYGSERRITGQAAVENLPDHVIYGISQSHNLVLLENNSQSETDFLEILYYGANSGKYGAMLALT